MVRFLIEWLRIYCLYFNDGCSQEESATSATIDMITGARG